MVAKSSKERSAKAAARRRERGEVILRLPTLEGTRQQLSAMSTLWAVKALPPCSPCRATK